jgi:UDP-N-acetyl-D-mannosaminuronate dehydrogenase
MNIGVIGVGSLGLSFSLLCKKNGYRVIGSETNITYVESLQKKTFKTTTSKAHLLTN